MVYNISSLHPYHRAPDQNSNVSYLGGIVAILAKGEDTGGRFTLMSGEVKRGSEPPPHVHEWEDEFYYVLNGEIEAHCGGDVFRIASGEVVFLPHGKSHVFSCVTPSVRLLVQAQASGEQGVLSDRFLIQLATPGGGTAATSDANVDATYDPAHVMRLAEAYGIRFLSPEEIASTLPHYLGIESQF